MSLVIFGLFEAFDEALSLHDLPYEPLIVPHQSIFLLLFNLGLEYGYELGHQLVSLVAKEHVEVLHASDFLDLTQCFQTPFLSFVFQVLCDMSCLIRDFIVQVLPLDPVGDTLEIVIIQEDFLQVVFSELLDVLRKVWVLEEVLVVLVLLD